MSSKSVDEEKQAIEEDWKIFPLKYTETFCRSISNRVADCIASKGRKLGGSLNCFPYAIFMIVMAKLITLGAKILFVYGNY